MPTEKQISANRRNASRSTGPRTNEGKISSSQNALRHGLSAKAILISDEDPEEFLRLLAELETQFKPDAAFVKTEVEQLAVLLWKRQRFRRIEAGIFSEQLRSLREDRLKIRLAELVSESSGLIFVDDGDGTEELDPGVRKKIKEVDRAHDSVLRQLDDLLMEERSDAEKLAAAFTREMLSGGVLEKLLRFETTNERAIQRCHERIMSLQSRPTKGEIAKVIDLEVVPEGPIVKDKQS